MKTKENYVMGEHLSLVEEKCIQVIEKELESFFEIRLKFIYLICELYIKGSIKIQIIFSTFSIFLIVKLHLLLKLWYIK